MALSAARVEAAIPTRPSPVHLGLHSVRPPHGSVQLALAVPATREDSLAKYESLSVMPGEAIRELRLRLKQHGWFSSNAPSTVVFGDRELADAVKTSDIIQASGKAHPSYLHVFVKLSDVETVSIRTLMRELSLANPAAAEAYLSATLNKPSRKSLLALPAVPSTETAAEGATSTADTWGSDSSADASSECGSNASDDSSHGRAVVHLMVHKSAKVNWRNIKDDKFELSISSSETVDSLMKKIEAVNGIALEPASILVDGEPLASGQPLAAYGISKGSRLELIPLEPEAYEDDALPDGSPSLTSPNHLLHRHWQAAREGLAAGSAPKLVAAGTGGSYFLQDVQGKPVAVFKPEDEEPLAVNNPKGRTPGSSADGSSSSPSGSEGLRRGTKPGEGAYREVAAYVLDHDHFSGVPPTALVSAYVDSVEGGAVKIGSLQQFIQSDGDCEERGYSQFPLHEVHKIAVLDLRLGNSDRNGGNILARRNPSNDEWELIPIDHGYCLPGSFEDLSFEWMYWPQAERPFEPETLQYIDNLDAERDESILQAHGIQLRPECLRVFRVCTMVLKKGAKAGLTPSQIASILCREGLTKSPVEKLHSNAMHLAKASDAAAASAGGKRADGMELYMRHMELLLDEYLEDFLLEGAELMY
eukprot:GHUV01000350.1.p1 GENE.GHUV01000350.1~~GHUV01000350.1.p1  ORF type:complete len:646 (+),score=230.80 GHUV01000350.1:469-2406(+)